VEPAIEQYDRPTARSTVIWSLLGLLLAAATSYAAVARGIDLVEVWRVHHPGIHGTVADIADCEYDDNYYVICRGRFTADDGSVRAGPVWLMADFINPRAPVPARIAAASDDRAWADDYQPGWGGWIALVVIMGAMSIGILTGIGFGIRSLVRRS
jgi:hypothetical protein